MRDSSGHLTSAFPAFCEVQGCTARPQEWIEIDDCTFEVCRAHSLHLRAGEAYSVKGEEILAGLDAASELIDVHSSASSTGPVITLELGHHGVIDQEVPIRVTPRLRASFADLLRDSEGPAPRKDQ
ncbi:hypothetical protein [Brachybacterium sp. FME24]|uniref:hypothetical protein n=1 Tax=Brachybacterium sp. FME24 TaxID=2742605 RepID=UPI001867DEE4|nr:hypothetical protein [Brachybacterium sp. FME24]